MLTRRRPLVLAALGLALGVGGPVTALALAAWVRRTGQKLIVASVSDVRAEVAMVLGARLGPDGEVRGMLEDRLVLGLSALRLGAVDRVLVTGHRNQAEAMTAWLRMRDVGDDLILQDHESPRTIHSMRRAVGVLGIRSALICTQRFHLPRALALAQHERLQAVGVSADRSRYRALGKTRIRELAASVRAATEILGSTPVRP